MKNNKLFFPKYNKVFVKPLYKNKKCHVKMDSEITIKDEKKEEISLKKRQAFGDKKRAEEVVFHVHLRVLPALKSGDSWSSYVLQCLFSQAGIFSVFIIWTLAFTIMIYFYENTQEQISRQERRDRIKTTAVELATELRQTDIMSRKWLDLIERALTRVKDSTPFGPTGTYWDLSGCFLFLIYLASMLDLVSSPETIVGTCLAVVYGATAIPLQYVLAWNVAKVLLNKIKRFSERKSSSVIPLNANFVCYGAPLAMIVCLLLGLVFFKNPEDFSDINPFLTKQEMGNVSASIRLLYSAYLEGALLLTMCCLLSLRATYWKKFSQYGEKYYLFTNE